MSETMQFAELSDAELDWPLVAQPLIRTAGRFALDDRGFERFYRGLPVALHCYEYRARFELGGRMYQLSPGDVTITPHWKEARYDMPSPGHHFCIHFSLGAHGPRRPSDVQPLGETFVLPNHVPAEAARVDGQPAADVMRRIARLQIQADVNPLARMSASLALQRLLLALGMSQQQTSDDAASAHLGPINNAAAIMRGRLHEPLNVPELAAEVGLSQNYLARRFKQRFGVTIPRYLLRIRMEHAQLLLSSTDLPVGQIAARVGMPDAQHFNKQFRAAYGVSPTAARSAR